jgi:hypothetical protein
MRLMLIISVLSAAFPSAASAQAYLGLEQPRPALTCDAAPDRQTPGCLSQGQVFVGTFENDSFGFTGVDTDRYYTHGTHFNVLLGSPRRASGAGPPDREAARDWNRSQPVDLRLGMGWGQNIYIGRRHRMANPQDVRTPPELRLDKPDQRVRPTAQYRRSPGGLRRSIRTVVVLPRRAPRHPIRAPGPRLRHQIEDELGFALQWERRWIDRWRLGGFTLDQTDFVGPSSAPSGSTRPAGCSSASATS